MVRATKLTQALPAIAIAMTLVGCETPAETSATTTAATTVAPATTAAPKPSAKPSAEVKKPTHPCPKGSEGDGTAKKPCKATGATRIMEVKWTGKIKDKGPSFSVKSLSTLEILYGKIVVYFYDKAGKQLEVEGDGGKKQPKLGCSGNIFAGPMKPHEKATLFFSCVAKKQVPEGSAAIEAEITMVGFPPVAGAKKSDTFWRNDDLAPKERPKGGKK